MANPGSRWRAKCHDRAGSFTIKERSVERDGERFVAEVRWSCRFTVEVAEVGPDGTRGDVVHQFSLPFRAESWSNVGRVANRALAARGYVV